MAEQLLWEPMMKAFVVLILCCTVMLLVVPVLPSPKTVSQICSTLVLAYFVVAVSGKVIEKTERLSIELFLAKPFSRSDILFADFLGTISVVSTCILLLSLGFWGAFGIRQGSGASTFISLFFSLTIQCIFLYCFIMLSGILIRNVGIVVILWVGYVYAGALLLEERAEFLNPGMPEVIRTFFDVLYYILPQNFAIGKSIANLFSQTNLNLLPILISGVSSAGALGLAIWLFNRHDL